MTLGERSRQGRAAETEGALAAFVRTSTLRLEPVRPVIATEQAGERVYLLTRKKPDEAEPGDEGPPREITEMGRIPAAKAAAVLARMAELVQHGRFDDVRVRLEEMVHRYPKDLLFLRQVAEFHIETGDRQGAMGALFTLARRQFEHHHLDGMRQTLEKALELDPTNQRAFRLLGLLERRPVTGTGA